LERGTEPYDIQVLYNVHFHGDIVWLMELIHEFSVKAGRQSDWQDSNWQMLSMGGYGCGARYLLDIAVSGDKPGLAEWLLKHGANPNAPPPEAPGLSKRSLYENALGQGHSAIAEALASYGAKKSPVALEGLESFTAACLRMDRKSAAEQLSKHPEYLQSPEPMFA